LTTLRLVEREARESSPRAAAGLAAGVALDGAFAAGFTGDFALLALVALETAFAGALVASFAVDFDAGFAVDLLALFEATLADLDALLAAGFAVAFGFAACFTCFLCMPSPDCVGRPDDRLPAKKGPREGPCPPAERARCAHVAPEK